MKNIILKMDNKKNIKLKNKKKIKMTIFLSMSKTKKNR